MTTALKSGTINTEAIASWAQCLIREGYKVIAPVRSGSEIEYTSYSQGPIALNEGLPRLSPKASWFPRTEPILKLHREGQTWTITDPVMEFPKTVILGARPCDASGREIQKALFGWDFKDAFFAKRSAQVWFVTVACTKPVDQACFCTSVGLEPTSSKGSDVVLTALSDGSFSAEAFTEAGSAILDKAGSLGPATPAETLEDIRKQAKAAVPVRFNAEHVRAMIASNFHNPIWEETSRGCVGCGTCAFSCPTCHCFDIQDEMIGADGVRQKNWDACMFGLFTLHTSGHNPRGDRAARWRQRVSHKFSYYPGKFNEVLCTGCGRCLRLCPGGLDLLATVQKLDAMDEAGKGVDEASYVLQSPGVMASHPTGSENLYHPYAMRIASVIEETRDVRTLHLEFANPEDSESFTFKPGQFGLYSAHGEGESTFCIASAPTRKGYIECTFREAGRVTKSLRRLEPGDTLGFRGPYGNSFPVDQWKGKNLVFVGGGIGVAPVRAVLQYCLDTRENYNKLTVVFGAKTWADHCYKWEMDQWRATNNLDLFLAIDWKFGPQGPMREDAAEPGWEPLRPGQKPGEKTTCFVPELVEACGVTPENTVAIVCGPPIMINKSVEALERLGLAKNNIYATLENRMKCGIGKCGRCNVGPVYVCKEGPVFTAEQLSILPPDM